MINCVEHKNSYAELAALDTPDDGPIGGPKHVGWKRTQ
jgi:hypothetical protein